MRVKRFHRLFDRIVKKLIVSFEMRSVDEINSVAVQYCSFSSFLVIAQKIFFHYPVFGFVPIDVSVKIQSDDVSDFSSTLFSVEKFQFKRGKLFVLRSIAERQRITRILLNYML